MEGGVDNAAPATVELAESNLGSEWRASITRTPLLFHASAGRRTRRDYGEVVVAIINNSNYLPNGYYDESSERGNLGGENRYHTGITRSLSKKGRPCDNAVDEPTDKTLKAEFVYQEQFESLRDLQLKLNDYVWRYNNERMRSTLGYMSPVEFRKAGLSL